MFVVDSKGIIYEGRTEGMNEWKQTFAVSTPLRTFDEAINGADIFIGLAGKDLIKEAHLKSMKEKPIIFALANPQPEISPAVAKATWPDSIVATGWPDFPNQVNDKLVFPFIYWAVLDVRAKKITTAMMLETAKAIAAVAKLDVP